MACRNRHLAANLPPGAELLDGEAVGRDPRKMSQAELRGQGHEPMTALEALCATARAG